MSAKKTTPKIIARENNDNPPVNNNLTRAAGCLQVLGHPTRLSILKALRQGERPVHEIEEEVGGTQSNVSQHLRLMRDRSIVAARKEGNQVFYRVPDPRVYAILDAVKEVFCDQ